MAVHKKAKDTKPAIISFIAFSSQRMSPGDPENCNFLLV